MEHNANLSEIGSHFLEFSIHFLKTAKSQYQQQNQIKANTLAFHTLLFLDEKSGHLPTMSEMAAELDITKQQLTKLINDLEERQLVCRIHDSKNRRQVYLSLTLEGEKSLSQLRELMLSRTMECLKNFSPKELEEFDDCLMRLAGLMKKFHPANKPV